MEIGVSKDPNLSKNIGMSRDPSIQNNTIGMSKLPNPPLPPSSSSSSPSPPPPPPPPSTPSQTDPLQNYLNTLQQKGLYDPNAPKGTGTVTYTKPQNNSDQVIQNYLNTLKNQGLYDPNAQKGTGNVYYSKGSGTVAYETTQGNLIIVDYSKGTIEAYKKQGDQLVRTEPNVSGTIKQTYEVKKDIQTVTYQTPQGTVTETKTTYTMIPIDRRVATIPDEKVREITQKTISSSFIKDLITSVPIAGQNYRMIETATAVNQLNQYLRQNKDAAGSVAQAAEIIKQNQLSNLKKETIFHGVAIVTSGIAGEVFSSILAGRAAMQAGTKAGLRVFGGLATAGAAENLLTDLAYAKIVENRNMSPQEALISAALGAISAGTLGTAINRLAVKGSKWSDRLLKASYLVDPYEKYGDILGEEIKRNAPQIAKAVKDSTERFIEGLRITMRNILPQRTTRVITPSITPTTTPTITQTTTVTTTQTITQTITPTVTQTPTSVPTPVPTPVSIPSIAQTIVPTQTITPLITPTQTQTTTPTQTTTTTATITPTPTVTQTPTPIPLFFREPIRKNLGFFGLMPIPPQGSLVSSQSTGRLINIGIYNELEAAKRMLINMFSSFGNIQNIRKR